MEYTIRASTPDDYEAIAAIANAAYPEDSLRFEPDTLRHIDRSLAPKYNLRRFVLEGDGKPVGAAHCYNMVAIYHPRKFLISISILPDYQRRGLGGRLYDHLIEHLRPFDPIRFVSRIREDMTAGCRFLEKRGFRPGHKEWESILMLDVFDPGDYADVIARVADQGIAVCDLNTLRQRPGWERDLYELIMHIQADMPASDTYTPMAYEDFCELVLKNPRIIPEGYFIATDGGRLVGASILHKDLRDRELLHTDDTGVHRDYRRRGIALALKAHSLAWAKQAGYKRVRTVNESSNRSMLTINERMGFAKFPAWIGFTLDLEAKR